jgi:hypothetical protein
VAAIERDWVAMEVDCDATRPRLDDIDRPIEKRLSLIEA